MTEVYTRSQLISAVAQQITALPSDTQHQIIAELCNGCSNARLIKVFTKTEQHLTAS